MELTTELVGSAEVELITEVLTALELVGYAEVELITEVVESIVVATSLEPVGSVDVVTSSELLVRYIAAKLDERVDHPM